MNKVSVFDLLFGILILGLAVTGCLGGEFITASQGSEPTQQVPALSYLRIKNDGIYDIKNLVILFPDNRIGFGDLPAGTTSVYRLASKGVYNYAACQYEQGGKVITQPVVDWVGEMPREGKNFTYIIDYDPNRLLQERIRLITIQDN